MHRLALPLIAALTLSGCVSYHTRSDGVARARLNQTITVDGPKVTPLKLIEDSRCPKGVQCVWAGQVKLLARVTLGSGGQDLELTLGEPKPVADGSLTLVEVLPDKKAGDTYYPDEYRFGFKFAGGL